MVTPAVKYGSIISSKCYYKCVRSIKHSGRHEAIVDRYAPSSRESMTNFLRKLVFSFIASSLLILNLIHARHLLPRRDIQPPIENYFPETSSYHRPWYGGRREAELPKKVFKTYFVSSFKRGDEYIWRPNGIHIES